MYSIFVKIIILSLMVISDSDNCYIICLKTVIDKSTFQKYKIFSLHTLL